MVHQYGMRQTIVLLLTAGLAISWLPVSQASETLYDTVILGGRVIDPESELDQIANVGIKDGQISAITVNAIAGLQQIDANGQVVSPGFIDIHSHTPTRLGEHLNILDGITTQLDLEAGAWPPTEYGDHFIGGAQLNYGSSVGHYAVRHAVMEGRVHSYFFTEEGFINTTGPTWTERASAEQIEQMRIRLIQGLEEGGLGIGVLLDYMTDAVSESELRMIFETAASAGKPIYIHVRRGMPGDPTGLEEAIALAEATGAPTMICHITHSAMGGINEWLAKIDAANARGARITTETLSWLAGGTAISADVFRNRDWRAIFDINYEDVQWVPTGEWLDEERFLRYQRDYPASSVNHHYVKEAWLLDALKWPDMMVSTDALPAFDLDVKTNPNIAGTFSHFLGRYVRDLEVMPLTEGLRRITLLPAQWLELSSEVFKKKGRLQVGADADIVVFDPDTIAAEAAYGDPYQPSVGISTVLVDGRLVASGGRRIEGRYPGKHILAPWATTTKSPY